MCLRRSDNGDYRLRLPRCGCLHPRVLCSVYGLEFVGDSWKHNTIFFWHLWILTSCFCLLIGLDIGGQVQASCGRACQPICSVTDVACCYREGERSLVAVLWLNAVGVIYFNGFKLLSLSLGSCDVEFMSQNFRDFGLPKFLFCTLLGTLSCYWDIIFVDILKSLKYDQLGRCCVSSDPDDNHAPGSSNSYTFFGVVYLTLNFGIHLVYMAAIFAAYFGKHSWSRHVHRDSRGRLNSNVGGRLHDGLHNNNMRLTSASSVVDFAESDNDNLFDPRPLLGNPVRGSRSMEPPLPTKASGRPPKDPKGGPGPKTGHLGDLSKTSEARRMEKVPTKDDNFKFVNQPIPEYWNQNYNDRDASPERLLRDGNDESGIPASPFYRDPNCEFGNTAGARISLGMDPHAQDWKRQESLRMSGRHALAPLRSSESAAGAAPAGPGVESARSATIKRESRLSRVVRNSQYGTFGRRANPLYSAAFPGPDGDGTPLPRQPSAASWAPEKEEYVVDMNRDVKRQPSAVPLTVPGSRPSPRRTKPPRLSSNRSPRLEARGADGRTPVNTHRVNFNEVYRNPNLP